MLCIIRALCNLNPRVLATLLFQRQNVVEKTRALLEANNTKHAKQEGISAADFVTDGVF